MNRTRISLAASIAVALLSIAGFAQAQEVAGAWTITVAGGPQGDIAFNAALTVEAEAIAGTLESPMGKFNVTGTVKGASIAFSGTPQQNFTITFTGTVAEGRMSGDADVGGFFSGKWTAERPK